ncbi:MAG: translational GTPase TypA [Clostridia bacterium]
MERKDLRNIAIIAHVDHGKTTLVDAMLKQCGAFRVNQSVDVRVMDNNDLEKERGITILAKNTSVRYKGTKINIIDTPGHADFGGEVERVLKMIDGVLLLVDAYEGTMPQTRFVLSKALDLNLKVIVCINKIDKADARIAEVENEVLDLLIDLGAGEEALNFPVVYCSGREGYASLDKNVPGTDLMPLFDTILNSIPYPVCEPKAPLQLLISAIDYNDYVGRIGIGKIVQGTLNKNDNIVVCDHADKKLNYSAKISNLYTIENLHRVPCEVAEAGEIVCISGIEKINIGNTVCNADKPIALPFVNVSEPTLQMEFCVNNSPFAGMEGKFVTTRHINDRLQKELLKDVSLRVEQGETKDSFLVSGRGEIHLSILIENMRREGFEFQVGKPKVLCKTVNGKKLEPMEKAIIDVPQNCVGVVMEKLGTRKAELQNMAPVGNRIRLEFLIPTRGLIGYRSDFMTDTAGEGIINTLFEGYAEYKGDIPMRSNGSLIAFESGDSCTYGLYNAQERGTLFIGAGTPVYAGMIVGVSPKTGDICVNVCKKKHVTNCRASGSDDALKLGKPKVFSLEEGIEFIEANEYLEITPKSIRMRKKVLDHTLRMRDDVKTGVVKVRK